MATRAPLILSTLLLVNTGGSVNIEGVTVQSPERPVELKPGCRYLLFLYLDETADGHPTRTGWLMLGASAAYEYDDLVDTWSPVIKNYVTPLVSELSRKSKGSFRSLRELLTRSAH